MKATCPARSALIAALAAAVFAAVPVRAESRDVTIEMTEGLIAQMFTDSRDALRIAATLRATRDPALVPLFEKLGANKSSDIQIAASIATAMLTKDPARLDISKLLGQSEPRAVNASLALVIDANIVSNEQLQTVVTKSRDQVARVMAASELQRRKALTDRSVFKEFIEDPKEEVRCYAAVTMLENKDEAETAKALAALNALTDKHDAKTAPIQALMVVRIRKDKITAALPWVDAVARDEKLDEGLRRTALSTLLALKHPTASQVFVDMASKQKETLPQLELGMMAIEYGDQLKPAHIAALEANKSSLPRAVAALARQSIDGADFTPGLLKLLKEGHPIVLNWALVYADAADPTRRLAIRNAIIEQSTIVDDQRRSDFERAAIAAQKLADEKSPAARAALAQHLKSSDQAIVEAVLAGIGRSDERTLSELVLPFWQRFSARPSVAFYNAANYAALILAREGRKEPKDWLAGMVQGGTLSSAQDTGFRVMAGWYYAKITNESDAMTKRLLAVKAKD